MTFDELSRPTGGRGIIGPALGQRLFVGGKETNDAEAFTVVGVVGRVKQAGLTDDAAQGAIYYPYVHRANDNVFIVARTALPPESLALTLQRVVRQIDPDLPVNDIRSMETRIASSLVAHRSLRSCPFSSQSSLCCLPPSARTAS